jgi:hypothetical protein
LICITHIAGFPRVLENLENNNFIFQPWKCPGILQSHEMSWKKYCSEKSPLERQQVKIMPVQENIDCRRKTVVVVVAYHSKS